MAKAIIGHLSGPDAQNTYETALLRRRVAELHEEIERLKSENDALSQALSERLDNLHPEQLLESIAR